MISSRDCGNSASLIVNIFENNPDWVSVSGNIISDVSDHFSQFCIFRSARDRIKPVKRKMRDFTNFDRDSFTQDLNQIDWQSIIANGNNDIDYIFSSFYSKYNKIINKHVPIKQISRRQLKRFSKPWITQGIRASIKTKNKLFASGDQTKYKFYRNKINHLIRIIKRGYFHDYFEKNLQNMKKTWEALNNLLNRKTKKSRHVNAIKDFNNGNKINRNPQRIANILNEHFASVGEKLARKIPASGDPRDFLKKTNLQRVLSCLSL